MLGFFSTAEKLSLSFHAKEADSIRSITENAESLHWQLVSLSPLKASSAHPLTYLQWLKDLKIFHLSFGSQPEIHLANEFLSKMPNLEHLKLSIMSRNKLRTHTCVLHCCILYHMLTLTAPATGDFTVCPHLKSICIDLVAPPEHNLYTNPWNNLAMWLF